MHAAAQRETGVQVLDPVMAKKMEQQVKQQEPEMVPPELVEERRKDSEGRYVTANHFMRGKLLGKGGFAKVYFAQLLPKKTQYALKIVIKSTLVKESAIAKLQTEIKIHRALRHTNIVRFDRYFEDKHFAYIALELCSHRCMAELLKRRKRLSEFEGRYYVIQLINALTFLHDNLVIHRDLKLGNIFISSDMTIKIGDFGLAAKLTNFDERKKTVCGTPNYIAPEILQGKKCGHSFPVDVWSTGVILYTLLVGKPPFESKDVKATYKRILSNSYSFPEHNSISAEAKTLITSLLQAQPENRPATSCLLDSPFFRGYSPRSLPELALTECPLESYCRERDSRDSHAASSHNKQDENDPSLANCCNVNIEYGEAGKPTKSTDPAYLRPASAAAKGLQQRNPNTDASNANAVRPQQSGQIRGLLINTNTDLQSQPVRRSQSTRSHSSSSTPTACTTQESHDCTYGENCNPNPNSNPNMLSIGLQGPDRHLQSRARASSVLPETQKKFDIFIDRNLNIPGPSKVTTRASTSASLRQRASNMMSNDNENDSYPAMKAGSKGSGLVPGAGAYTPSQRPKHVSVESLQATLGNLDINPSPNSHPNEKPKLERQVTPTAGGSMFNKFFFDTASSVAPAQGQGQRPEYTYESNTAANTVSGRGAAEGAPVPPPASTQFVYLPPPVPMASSTPALKAWTSEAVGAALPMPVPPSGAYAAPRGVRTPPEQVGITAKSEKRGLGTLEAMHEMLSSSFSMIEQADSGTLTRMQGQGVQVDAANSPRDDMSMTLASKVWVVRYVDYTSKYGLGFLFNTGSAGVYFNDSTKIVLSEDGAVFQYIERRKREQAPSQGEGSGSEYCLQTHAIDHYPAELQKKVTLLKHFRTYLMDQQNNAVMRAAGEQGTEGQVEMDGSGAVGEMNGSGPCSNPTLLKDALMSEGASKSVKFGASSCACPMPSEGKGLFAGDADADCSGGGGGGRGEYEMPFLKKWVRTKHAILFRISNRTVQVVFYDRSEVLMCSDTQVITYVNKAALRTQHTVEQVVADNRLDIAKRLRYTKDIFCRLIRAQNQTPAQK